MILYLIKHNITYFPSVNVFKKRKIKPTSMDLDQFLNRFFFKSPIFLAMTSEPTILMYLSKH